MRWSRLFSLASAAVIVLLAAPARATPPNGNLDVAGCDDISGWAQDPDDPGAAVEVHLYFDAPAGSPDAKAISTGPANIRRADLCEPLGSCEHGFQEPMPFAMIDGQDHAVFAYGIDTSGNGENPQLGDPATFNCTPNVPPSSKRHVASELTFGAWHFDLFRDVMTVRDDVLDKMPNGPELASPPVIARPDDASDLYLVDGAVKHKIGGPAVLRRWHLEPSTVVVRPAAEMNALAEASPLRARPWLAKGSGTAVYLLFALDDAFTDAGAPSAGPPRDAGFANPRDASSSEGSGCNAGGGVAGTSLPWLLLAATAFGVKAYRRRSPTRC